MMSEKVRHKYHTPPKMLTSPVGKDERLACLGGMTFVSLTVSLCARNMGPNTTFLTTLIHLCDSVQIFMTPSNGGTRFIELTFLNG